MSRVINMKKQYIEILFDIQRFEEQDVIVTSSPLDALENFGDIGDFEKDLNG